MYRNSDGRGDTLFCFAEQHVYRPVDVLKRGLLEKPVELVFQRLWNKCDESRRQMLIDLYGQPVDFIPECWKRNKERLEEFKFGKISLDEVLDLIVSSVE